MKIRRFVAPKVGPIRAVGAACALAVCSLAPVAVSVSAQSSSAQPSSAAPWYGLAPPAGLAAPPALSAIGAPGFTAPPSPVPPGEERHTALEGELILALVGEIVGFSRASHGAGERMWGRVSGFPAAVATADWVAERFREAGLQDVAVQRYPATGAMWWPDDWEVRLLGDAAFGPGSGDIVLHSAVPARGSLMPEAIAAPIVYMGDVGAFRDVDVRGKIAIQRIPPTGSAFGARDAASSGAQALFGRGAVAVLTHVDQPGNMHIRDFGGCAACFNIGGEDGRFLRALVERAEREGNSDRLRLRVFLNARERTGLTAQNVVGVVPGASREVVIVNAHLDGWYDAAGDNADGLAVLVALARHFARPENLPARTLVFVASGGHHSTGMNGPGNFVRMNPEISERTVLVLNLEHIAQFAVDPATFEVQRTEQSMGWGITNLAPALIELTDRARTRYGFRIREQYSTSVAGDLGQYASLGVPRVQAIHAGPLYHTSADVLQTISVEGLERSARFYAYWIDGVARLPVREIDP